MIGLSKSYTGNRKVLSKKGRAILTSDYVESRTLGDTLLNTAIKDGVEWDFMKRTYEVNPWIRAIVDKIIARNIQVDIYPQPIDMGMDAPRVADDKQKKRIEKVMMLFQRPNDQYETFGSLRTKYLKDVLIYDNGNAEIVKNGSENFMLYCNAPGFEVYPKVDKNAQFFNEAYEQIHKRKKVASWRKNELMYFCRHRCSGTMRGFSPIESLAMAIMGDLYSDKYNLDFFSNNARPNLIFLFKNLGFGNGDAAIRRAQNWYTREHEGKPHKPMFMGAEKGEVDVKPMQLSNKDMEHKEYQLMMLSKMMAVYGMQPFVLGLITDTTGKLNSEEQTNQFKIDAVMPYLRMTCDVFNLVLLWDNENFGYSDIYLTHDDLDLRDQKKTAEMYETYLKTGVVTINQVRQELKMAPVEWGDVPYIPVNIAPLGGAAPNRMSQNPAAADSDAPFQQKNLIPTGLDYVQDSVLKDALIRILSARERVLSTTFSFPSNIED